MLSGMQLIKRPYGRSRKQKLQWGGLLTLPPSSVPELRCWCQMRIWRRTRLPWLLELRRFSVSHHGRHHHQNLLIWSLPFSSTDCQKRTVFLVHSIIIEQNCILFLFDENTSRIQRSGPILFFLVCILRGRFWAESFNCYQGWRQGEGCFRKKPILRCGVPEFQIRRIVILYKDRSW